MVRTQIQLTDEQARVLHQRAAQRGTSMALLIREAIDAAIAQDDERERRLRALEVIGSARSGHRDISVDHDRYLAEDFR